MKRLALVAAGAAVAGLAACTSSTPSAPPAGGPVSSDSPNTSSSPVTSSPPRVTMPAAPARCAQAYDTWVKGKGKGLVAALSAVGSAGQAGDIQVLRVLLNRTKPALATAARYPMPTCADPSGYWPVLLMHVNAAASTSSTATLTAAMEPVPTLTRELSAELKRTEG